jgi:HPt (histidine-containing phosphotransfer) domain-containing protein
MGKIDLKQLYNILMHRLKDKGLVHDEIDLFLRDAVRIFAADSHAGLREMNRRLNALGWDGIDLDDHTLQLIIAQFENEEAGD